jgi:hypothetical protein
MPYIPPDPNMPAPVFYPVPPGSDFNLPVGGAGAYNVADDVRVVQHLLNGVDPADGGPILPLPPKTAFAGCSPSRQSSNLPQPAASPPTRFFRIPFCTTSCASIPPTRGSCPIRIFLDPKNGLRRHVRLTWPRGAAFRIDLTEGAEADA